MAKGTPIDKALELLKVRALREYEEVKAHYEALTRKYTAYGWLTTTSVKKLGTKGIRTKVDFDKLKAFVGSGSKTVNEIAEEFAISPRAASQQTRSMVGRGLVKKDKDGNVSIK
ncbi:MAG: hypothetical protein JWR69_3996 [Pedosphaera sp.]|nr:hypothetical protein [Pedosphaera sp.]